VAVTSRVVLAVAALLLGLATALGAYASHGLDGVLDAPSLRSFEIAVEYQFFQALGLVGVGLLLDRDAANRAYLIAAVGLALGMLLFCGGLYASALDGPRVLAGAAPFGGTLLILSWLVCAFGAVRGRRARGREG
jgi:uncharacterized membrane protein YgdD (TMEM256/DUF423 family)